MLFTLAAQQGGIVDHIVTVRSRYTDTDPSLVINCTCDEGEIVAVLAPKDGTRRVSLDDINAAANDHIEAMDRTPIVR